MKEMEGPRKALPVLGFHDSYFILKFLNILREF